MVGFVELSDNKDLSEEEFKRCKALAADIRDSVRTRGAFVSKNGLDPEFCLPAALWALDGSENDFYIAYKHVVNGNYDVFNRLRFFSQVYTGYQLMFLREARGYNSVNAIPPDYREWLKARLKRSDVWVYKWKEATRYLPEHLIHSPPWKMGEIGWRVGDIVVNHDTYVYQERLNIMYENGILGWLVDLSRHKTLRILEIGGGYGGLARALTALIGNTSYSICDLPESLLFSGSYLKVTANSNVQFHADLPARGFDHPSINLIPNYLFPLLARSDTKFDLVINTSSFSELSANQLNEYCGGIKSLIGGDGIFYEQNHAVGVSGNVDCKKIVAAHFPFRKGLGSVITRPMEGPAEVWSSRPFAEIIDAQYRPQVRGPNVISNLIRKMQTVSNKLRQSRFTEF